MIHARRAGTIPPSSESDNFHPLIALPRIPTIRQLCCSRLLLGGVSWKHRIYFPLDVRSCTNGRWAAAPGLCGTRGPSLRSSSTSNVKRVLLSVLYVCVKISVLPLAQTPTRNSRSVSRFRHPYISYSEVSLPPRAPPPPWPPSQRSIQRPQTQLEVTRWAAAALTGSSRERQACLRAATFDDIGHSARRCITCALWEKHRCAIGHAITLRQGGRNWMRRVDGRVHRR